MAAPKIRFKGFDEVWVQHKLGEVYKTYSGQTPLRSNASNFENPTIPWIKTTDLKNSEIFYNEENISTKGAKALKLLPVDTVLIAMYGGFNQIGRTGLLTYPATINQALTALEPNKRVNAYFLLMELNHKVNDWKTFAASSRKDPNITKKDVEDFSLILPTLPEQTAIGNFFHILDDIIALHKRKLDCLKALKSGYLQQMFPQTGESVPRVRFAGFDGDWAQRKLGDMLIERNEQIEETAEYPLMSFVANLGVVPKGEQYDRSFLVKDDNKKYKKTNIGDFIYSSNNLETGSIGFNRTGNAVISPVYSIFYSKNDSESQFIGLLSLRRDFINKMIHFRQGVMYGQWRIHENDFLQISIMAPAITEQNKIIRFFRNLDEQIASQTQVLERLKQLKAGYLQRMFV